MSPAAVQGDTIYDLPAVVNAATELAGALWEIEALAGPVAGAYVNKKLTTEQFVAYLLAQGGGASGPVAGRNRGEFTPDTAYLQKDMITRGAVGYYALADFTSGSDFNPANWGIFAGNAEIYVDANSNLIIGANRSHSIAGNFNSIYSGQDCHIDNVDSSFNSIRDSDGSSILGGSGNAIASSSGCTIPASCSKVLLLNCDSFTPPEGVSGVTYINNVQAGVEQVNVADVPAAKRIQVVNDIAASVAAGGQAVVLEPDADYAGKFFKDNRTPSAPYKYEALQEANPTTGATQVWWNRFRIQ